MSVEKSDSYTLYDVFLYMTYFKALVQSVVLFKSLTYFSSRIQIFASRKYDLRYLCDGDSQIYCLEIYQIQVQYNSTNLGTVVLLLVYIDRYPFTDVFKQVGWSVKALPCGEARKVRVRLIYCVCVFLLFTGGVYDFRGESQQRAARL